AMLAAITCETICALTVGLVHSTRVSTRYSRLRLIQSADEMNTRALRLGRAAPLAKHTIRECSRNRPAMDLTRKVSLRPVTPGRSPQMPRITSEIFTPARDAA